MAAPTNATLKASLEAIVAAAEKYGKGMTEGGAHYVYPAQNTLYQNGIMCANCEFFKSADNTCSIVDGYIYEYGVCRFWIIPDSKLTTAVSTPLVYAPAQTTGFDMSTMMNMIMMVMMLGIVMSMMKPIMGATSA